MLEGEHVETGAAAPVFRSRLLADLASLLTLEADEATMTILLQIDFDFHGPWGPDMTPAMRELAESIAAEPGLIWKIWTENPDTHEAGGIYLFTDRSSADAYLTKHRQRLHGFGIQQVNAKVFAVNAELSRIDRAPLPD